MTSLLKLDGALRAGLARGRPRGAAGEACDGNRDFDNATEPSVVVPLRWATVMRERTPTSSSPAARLGLRRTAQQSRRARRAVRNAVGANDRHTSIPGASRLLRQRGHRPSRLLGWRSPHGKSFFILTRQRIARSNIARRSPKANSFFGRISTLVNSACGFEGRFLLATPSWTSWRRVRGSFWKSTAIAIARAAQRMVAVTSSSHAWAIACFA